MRSLSTPLLLGTLLSACDPSPPAAPIAPTPPKVELFEATSSEGSVSIRAILSDYTPGSLVIRLGSEEIWRHDGPLYEHRAELFEPGDYDVALEWRGRTLAHERLFARSVFCAGGKRRLFSGVAPHPTLLTWSDGHLRAEIPRWVPQDRDAAYLVEWLEEGVVRFETRGRESSFDRLAQRMEGATDPRYQSDFGCAFSLGETYAGPAAERDAARWGIRVHREGLPSLAGHVDEDGHLVLHVIDTPARITRELEAIPSSCYQNCPEGARSTVVRAGERPAIDAPCARAPKAHRPHVGDGGVAHPRPYDPAEFRAEMRSAEPIVARMKLNEVFLGGETGVEHPVFEYDPNLSPDTNWYARRSYEAADDAAYRADEIARRRLALRLVPAFDALVAKGGDAFTAEETPRPVSGWDGR